MSVNVLMRGFAVDGGTEGRVLVETVVDDSSAGRGMRYAKSSSSRVVEDGTGSVVEDGWSGG